MPQLQRRPSGQTIHPVWFDEPDVGSRDFVEYDIGRLSASSRITSTCGTGARAVVDPVPLRLALASST